MLSDLIKTLERVGKATILQEYPDGSRVLLMPYGGRVLGLFGSHTDENFLWTNPALENWKAAQEFFLATTWHNSGGDRTWLAPEIDLFFPKFPDLTVYWQPRQLDPGTYSAEERNGEFILNNRLALTFSRSRQNAELEISKSTSWALNPLRYTSLLGELPDVEYAGYTLKTSLKFTSSTTCEVGLWNLLQMPFGGELFVVSYAKCEVTHYIGQIGPNHLTINERLIRFKMSESGVNKIGFRSTSVTGRVGYVYRTGNQYALIVRNCFVNPSGAYLDAPKLKPNNIGDAVQACSVNSTLGRFSELEYHVPAIGNVFGQTHCSDISQVWAFRGPREQIDTVTKTLLGVESESQSERVIGH